MEALNIAGYDVEISQTISSKGKGRVLAFVKSNSGFKHVCQLENSLNDILVFRGHNSLVTGIYAGFKTMGNETVSSNFTQLLKNLSLVCSSSEKIVIGGDFNADPKRTECPKSRALDLWQIENGVDQHVHLNTRFRTVDGVLQQSLIDHVYTKGCDPKDIELIPSDVSDHVLVKTVFNSSRPLTKVFFKKQTVIDWRNFSEEKMSSTIEAMSSELVLHSDANAANRELTTIITEAMNKLIPKRIVHTRRPDDVVSYCVEALKKRRDRLFKKARSGCVESMRTVKELNIAIKRLVKKERQRIIRSKMKDSSLKTFWHTVNTLLGKSVGPDDIQLFDENNVALNQDDMVQAFADFFRTKVEKLAAKNGIIDDVHPDLVYEGTREFSQGEIEKALSSFKPKKSFGPDEIPMTVLKSCAKPLMPQIQQLFKLITSKGAIPKVWKVTCIKPIHKKGAKTCVENYRPISNLNLISKLFERCMERFQIRPNNNFI